MILAGRMNLDITNADRRDKKYAATAMVLVR
jgi:hypothetical protein